MVDLKALCAEFCGSSHPDDVLQYLPLVRQVAETVLEDILSRQGPITFRPMGSSDECRAMVVGVHEIEALKREICGEEKA